MTFSLAGQRILLAAEYIGHGGTRTYFKNLVRFYADAGADVAALTTYPSSDSDMNRFVCDHGFSLETFENIAKRAGDGHLWETPALWSPRHIWKERQIFERYCDERGIDRVVVSVGTSGLFLSATHARPRPIMIAHGYPHGRRQDLLGKRIHANRAPSDLQIITVSEFSARLFRRMWGTEKRGIKVQAVWSSCGQPVQESTPLAGRNLSVVSASLVESYKEPFHWINIADHILRGSAGLESADFTWLGDGPLLQQARERATQTGRQSIRFPGWDDEPEKIYMRSRVYLQTSSKEALGLSVVDAVRHGLPCVVTEVGGLPEVVSNNVSGFVVPPGDVVAASAAVEELLQDDSTWTRMSKAASDLYLERFTPQMWQKKLLAAHKL